jgi:hypothetical protein
MTITITQAHNEARLNGTLTFLDTGSNSATMRIYEGTRPVSAANAPTGSTLLVEITLTKPAGAVAAGALTLTQEENGLIMATGLSTWARFINGNGATAFDADVDDGVNNGEVVMAQRQLFAGGEAKLVSAILG